MDPFGIRWMIATPVGDVSEQERATEAEEFSQERGTDRSARLISSDRGRVA